MAPNPNPNPNPSPKTLTLTPTLALTLTLTLGDIVATPRNSSEQIVASLLMLAGAFVWSQVATTPTPCVRSHRAIVWSGFAAVGSTQAVTLTHRPCISHRASQSAVHLTRSARGVGPWL